MKFPAIASWACFLASICLIAPAATNVRDWLSGKEERICFNAKFDEYRQCKAWAIEQLRAGHPEESLKSEVDGDEEETVTEFQLSPRETDA